MTDPSTSDGKTPHLEPSNTASEVSATTDLGERTSRRLKRLISWSVWLGSSLIAAVFLLGAGLTMLSQPWLVEIARQHFAATIGLPFAALAAFAIVTILESSSGPLEFEGLTFKFKGASGPAVLWALCFLVIAAAIKALW